jgi:hypothetical protein
MTSYADLRKRQNAKMMARLLRHYRAARYISDACKARIAEIQRERAAKPAAEVAP